MQHIENFSIKRTIIEVKMAGHQDSQNFGAYDSEVEGDASIRNLVDEDGEDSDVSPQHSAATAAVANDPLPPLDPGGGGGGA